MIVVIEVKKEDQSVTNYSTGYYRIVRIAPCQGKIQWKGFSTGMDWQDMCFGIMSVSCCIDALNRITGIWNS